MNLYVYTDNRKQVELAKINASTLAEADAMLKETTGIDATKNPMVGCQIFFNV